MLGRNVRGGELGDEHVARFPALAVYDWEHLRPGAIAFLSLARL